METNTEQGEISGIARLRAKLGQKAKLEPKFRFYTLYHQICKEEVLYLAWQKVKQNGGSAGIDGISIRSIEERGIDIFLNEIQAELKDKAYHPKPVKRVYIPKSDGKLRPLGIPTVKDRVVQAAVLLIIEPIFEQDFLDCSYGFRPERSAHQAIGAIKQAAVKGQLQVYDADLKSYFDTIPHDNLMKALEVRIADRQILSLINKWLRAPIWEPGKPMKANDRGTPQGGIISPLLANLYMHWFDKCFQGNKGPGTWAKATLVRYADDFVIMAKYMTKRIVSWVEELLENKFGLTVNREKTKIVDLNDPKAELQFLGFRLKEVPVINRISRKMCLITPSQKSMNKAMERISEITDSSNGFMLIEDIIGEINKFLTGWGSYFQLGHPGQAFNKLNSHVHKRIYRFLQRRSQRGYRKQDRNQTWYAYIQSLGVIQLTKRKYQMKAQGKSL